MFDYRTVNVFLFLFVLFSIGLIINKKKTILLKQRSSAAGIFSKRNYTYLEQERALLLPDETSSALWDKSAMLIEGLRILSPKNKFFLMQDMMKKINDGHALDPKHQVGLRPMKGGEQNG